MAFFDVVLLFVFPRDAPGLAAVDFAGVRAGCGGAVVVDGVSFVVGPRALVPLVVGSGWGLGSLVLLLVGVVLVFVGVMLVAGGDVPLAFAAAGDVFVVFAS
ncbi:hypothetical protein [Janthinobacterium sp. 344]|uniref:hypothetical protein n=1 Tax=Janthinobacterium sp. 344 TaxID=1566280 RepID=UPI000B887CA4|nr:hypothetical protein [Janthinobacterium sp. 344]